MDLKLVYMALIFWCGINLPFTLLYYNYNISFFGSCVFFIGVFILLIIGLIVAHSEDMKINTRRGIM